MSRCRDDSQQQQLYEAATIWREERGREAGAMFEYAFDHGVASGDPSADGAVLWTRVTHRRSEAAEAVTLRWTVLKEDSGDEVASGEGLATQERDWTFKVVVDGLDSGTAFTYQFHAAGDASASPVGAFKTLPAAGVHVDQLRYGIFSCSNWGWGYFNAYDAASRLGLDFAVHLGDYYYEYGSGHYPSVEEAVRWEGLEPRTELLTLADYRKRHALTRRDSSLQRLTSRTALIAIWDDHEVANNQFTGGAENHQPETEGSFEARRAAAVQAYHEWLPTRPPEEAAAYYRTFTFGDLASMLVLETRMLNRTDPDELPSLMDTTAAKLAAMGPKGEDVFALGREAEAELAAWREELDAYRSRPDKSLLSSAELRWVEDQTRAAREAGQTWTIFAQQIVMADLRFADFEGAVRAARARGEAELAREWDSQVRNATCSAEGTGKPLARSYAPTAYLADEFLQLQELSQGECLGGRSGFVHGKYGIPFNLDQWSGYLAERERFFEAVARANDAKGGHENALVVYSGDSHNAWASDLRRGRGEQGPAAGDVVAAEYGVTSVSSTGFESFMRFVSPELVTAGFEAANPDLV